MNEGEVYHASHHGQHLTLWVDGGKCSWADGHGCTEGGHADPLEAINAFVTAECERHQNALQCAEDARLALGTSDG